MKVFAKLEWYNPFGSVKDRAAYWMLKEGERRGVLKKGGVLVIEPTSGNTGIALAGIAKLMGYALQAVMPRKVSDETKALIRSFGAEILETDDDLCPRVGPGTDQCIALAEAIVKGHSGNYFMPNQYENDANFLAHYESTGPEIWRDTNGEVTHFVTGIGTGGTITGVAKYLKEKNPDVRVYAVEPQKNHNLQGLRNMEESAMPTLLKRRVDLIDEWIRVTDEQAFFTVQQIAEKEGLFVGPSSGAVMYAALKVAEREKKGNCVAIFADDGHKYKSVYEQFKVPIAPWAKTTV